MDDEQTEIDATQGEQSATEAAARPMSERDRMMEEIAARRAADMEAESGEATEAEPAPAAANDEDALQREVQAQQAAQATPAAPADKLLEADLDHTLVKVKIDGEERTVPIAQVIADAQKHGAADQRLAEAARILREARESQAAQAAPQKAEAPAAQEGAAQAKDFVDALLRGDESEAVTALASLIPRPSPQGTAPDPQAIAAQVKASIEADAALQRAIEAHPQLTQDPDIAALADAKVARRIASGETFSQAITAVGAELSQKLGWSKKDGPQAPAASDGRDAKLEQKRARDAVIRGQNLSAATSEPPPQTASEVIAEMQAQRSRGQWQPKAR